MSRKKHAPTLAGKIVKLFPESGYGILETPLGKECLVHRSHFLAGRFERLRVGTGVELIEAPDELRLGVAGESEAPPPIEARPRKHARPAPRRAG